MKKITLILICAVCSFSAFTQDYERQFLLAGASFGVPENGWFELVCEAFNAKPLNRAVSSESIKDTAVDMYDGEFYTMDELANIDALIIMHVHDQNVAYTNGIKENYEDYNRSEIQQYHIGYDYVIKKYKADCESLNKPATIILCTHWHDSRTVYNTSIRALAEKWDLPLIKWDDNIGFTKKVLDPDGKQPSLKYAKDTQKQSDGVTYGWHPLHGKGQYIQQKIAWICMEELEKLFGVIPVSAIVSEKSKMVLPGDEAFAAFSFTGVPPWKLTYSVNGQGFSLDNIIENPVYVKIDIPASENAIVRPEQISNNSVEEGTVSGDVTILQTDRSLQPFFDTFAHQASPTVSFISEDYFQIKGTTPTHTREAFISFDISKLKNSDEKIIFRTYYYERIYHQHDIAESHIAEIAGNTKKYTALTWNNRPNDFTPISQIEIKASELGSYISWHITDWVKEQIAKGISTVTFRLSILNSGSGLLNFYSSESSDTRKPQILVYPGLLTTGKQDAYSQKIDIFTDIKNKQITINGIEGNSTVSLFSLNGQELYSVSGISAGEHLIHAAGLSSGVYILQVNSAERNNSYKILL